MFKNIVVDLALTPESFAANLKDVFEMAYKVVGENRDVMVDKAVVNHQRSIRAANYVIGDVVWLLDATLKKGQSKAFKKNWVGPYNVVEILSQSNYVIQSQAKPGQRKVVNTERLKLSKKKKERHH